MATNDSEAAGQLPGPALMAGAAIGLIIAALFAGSVLLVLLLATGAAAGAVIGCAASAIRTHLRGADDPLDEQLPSPST